MEILVKRWTQFRKKIIKLKIIQQYTVTSLKTVNKIRSEGSTRLVEVGFIKTGSLNDSGFVFAV